MGPLGVGGFREYLSQLGLGEAPAALPGLGTGYDENGVPLPSGQSPYMAQLGTAPTMQSAGAAVPVNTPFGQAIIPHVAQGMADFAMAPGRAVTGEMQVRDPETGALTQGATDWGAGTALGMLGSTSIPRGPSLAAGEALLGSGPYRNMTQVPSIRGMPAAEGIAVARTEPHLIPAQGGTDGAFIGGPRNVQSYGDLQAVRQRFDDFVGADPRGGDWYDRFRNDISSVTGNNPNQNHWMARQEGQWSAGASPEAELGFALKENNSALAGTPTKAGRPASHESFMRAIAENDPTHLARGDKTGEYAFKINPDNARAADTATGVNDFRHQRQLEYTNADGSLPSSGNHMVQGTIHKFMDYETALAADRANLGRLGDRTNWNGEQIQAAPWVRQKAESLMERNPNLSYDEAFARANTTIGDFYDKHTAFATHEAVPGADTGHLPGFVGSSDAARAAYTADPRSTWANAPGGRDAIYGGMQLGDTGVAMRVRPTVENQGLYTPPGGVLETNPGFTARPLVAFDSGVTKAVPGADAAILNAGEATRGYIDAQNASAWHKPWVGGQPGQSNSLFIPMEGKATPQQMLDLRAVTERHGLGDVVDTGQGLTATSFYPGPPEGAAMNKAMRGGLPTEVNRVLPGAEIQRAKVDSGYIPYEDKWTQGVGSGAATRELLSHVNAQPGVRAALNNNSMIPQNALARMERDTQWSSSMGATRADIQNARAIIGEGPGWVDRLEAALKSGALLPAVAAGVLGVAATAGQRQGE